MQFHITALSLINAIRVLVKLFDFVLLSFLTIFSVLLNF